MRRVAITGMGIWSCLGTNLGAVKESLYKGTSGIVVDLARKDWGYRSCLTGKVETPQLKGVIDRRSRIQLSEEAEYAYMSTVEALKNAKMDQDDIDSHEAGILF